MKMHFINTFIYSFRFLAVALTISSSLLLAQTVEAAAAGKVVFATGTSQASDGSGTSRALRRGDEVFSGDRLSTAARSRLQISFIDGAYISLQPNSQYEIEEYNFSGKQDGTEKANYNLIKGGVRAVTGLIGKKNNDAYKVKTAVATIGIRGTGHNTRICAGDCGKQKDGLYHNTWEGVTTVENDIAKVEVPAGKGVFVQDLDSPIVPLDQPSVVTAVESTKEKSEEQEEEEERTGLVSTGEQRTGDDGLQVVVIENEQVIGAISRPDPTFSEVLTGQVLQAVAPELSDPDSVDAPLLSALSIFKNADGKPVGVLGFDEEENIRQFATIDLAALLGGDNATAVAEVEALLDGADTSDLSAFLNDPASVAEFTATSGLGFGRWADGQVLSIFADGEVGFDDLVDNQSIHFIFGPELNGVLATVGTATYNFIGGTDSTSVSGATIGNGVTNGFLTFDFATSEGFINLDVSHSGTNYLVVGELDIFRGNNSFGEVSARAFTGTAGSACNPSCNTFIDGTFFDPISSTFPQFAGLEYDIQDTDVVTGVAAFQLNNPATPASQVLTGQGFLFVQKEHDPVDAAIEPTDAGNFFSTNVFLDASSQPIGFLGTERDDDGMITEDFRVFAVTDINAALNSDNPAVAAEALGLLNAATPEQIAQALENPARVLEFMAAGSVSFGRWGDGNLLAADRNLTNPADGEESTLISFTGNQSLHFIYGPEPGPIPTSGGATYNFLYGTQSTSISGATIGNGIIGGSISISDFSTNMATLSMSVDHNGSFYSVGGPLTIDPTTSSLFDTGLTASTGTAGSACNPSCPAIADGIFLGPTNGSSQPSHIGLEYEIAETDDIIGIGLFGNP